MIEVWPQPAPFRSLAIVLLLNIMHPNIPHPFVADEIGLWLGNVVVHRELFGSSEVRSGRVRARRPLSCTYHINYLPSIGQSRRIARGQFNSPLRGTEMFATKILRAPARSVISTATRAFSSLPQRSEPKSWTPVPFITESIVSRIPSLYEASYTN